MFIIAIDIDGTIQGDITPQVNEYTLINKIGLKYNSKNYLQEDYQKGLLRPFFVNFIDVFKKRKPQIELFIYTASEPGWANTIVNTPLLFIMSTENYDIIGPAVSWCVC